jgi:SAM-dependent methyltransferase
MAVHANIGCGRTPTPGWRNFDNSPSLRLAGIPVLPSLLWRCGVLNGAQFEFIHFARRQRIEYGDAVRGLPISSGSLDAVYSSHMLEHLDCAEADAFLREVRRLLRPWGVVRLAVPDIAKQIADYQVSGDADGFIRATQLCVARPRSLAGKLIWLWVGGRHHQWMYDGSSLCALLGRHGFLDARVLGPGETSIADRGELDLHERAEQSVYVEARSPG